MAEEKKDKNSTPVEQKKTEHKPAKVEKKKEPTPPKTKKVPKKPISAETPQTETQHVEEKKPEPPAPEAEPKAEEKPAVVKKPTQPETAPEPKQEPVVQEDSNDDDLDVTKEEYKPHGTMYYIKLTLAIILGLVAALMLGEGIMRFQGSSLTTFFAEPVQQNDVNALGDVDFGDLEDQPEDNEE